MKMPRYIAITLSLFVLLSACRKETNVADSSEMKSDSHASTPSIVGKWQTPGMQVVAFNEDRTMTITDAGTDFPGRYTLLEGSKIELDTGGGKITQKSYYFKDANTLMMSDETSAGKEDEFRRITHKQQSEGSGKPAAGTESK